MTKSPYEIRLDILSIASENLRHNQVQKLTEVRDLTARASGNGRASYEAERALSSIEKLKPITTEEILAEAQKLYGFVEQKPTKGNNK